jgi:hypothetical protein
MSGNVSCNNTKGVSSPTENIGKNLRIVAGTTLLLVT